MTTVKQFYDELQFPGHYTAQQMQYHSPEIKNPYISIIDRYVTDRAKVLDLGCGTGLITNLLASKHSSATFTAVDFADSIEYARAYAESQQIYNVRYIKQNILEFPDSETYDLVICQGVLHHVPEYLELAGRLARFLIPGGKLILACYHPWGKIAKRFLDIDYGNDILYRDQELVPYETAWSPRDILAMFPGFNLIDGYPRVNISIRALFNYRNGGLTTYVLEKRK